jgi:hypothetical protein
MKTTESAVTVSTFAAVPFQSFRGLEETLMQRVGHYQSAMPLDVLIGCYDPFQCHVPVQLHVAGALVYAATNR